MEIRTYGAKKILIADENKHIRDINDTYEEEHYDEEGNLILHQPMLMFHLYFLTHPFILFLLQHITHLIYYHQNYLLEI